MKKKFFQLKYTRNTEKWNFYGVEGGGGEIVYIEMHACNIILKSFCKINIYTIS